MRSAMKNKIAVILFALTTLHCIVATAHVNAAESHSNVVCYFIPFKMETYGPITTKNIKKYGRRLELSRGSADTLLRLVNRYSTSGKVDRYRIRLLVISGGVPQVFVDAEGNLLVVKTNKKDRLNQSDVDRIDDLLRPLWNRNRRTSGRGI